MRTGIATVSLSGTLEEKMRACAIAGFDGIEIFEQDLVTSALRPERIRSMAEDLGLSLDLYQPFRDFDG
ncbi:MAG TPA: sugar phosphate isomerase/epimerase and 4-hydroxyphenylpyruvate domain-containing protein, partial [Micrococcaceae bacterium]|nr:sugar phosphate isomerase/epimerase and 4-hydroxyphenylpyruvate domain-containing protein [Micrococcaceae bacterium]